MSLILYNLTHNALLNEIKDAIAKESNHIKQNNHR